MKQSSIGKMAVVLLVICAAAGLLLGTVYEATKDKIAEKKESVNQEAYRNVLPGAQELLKLEVPEAQQDKILEVYEAEQGYAIKVLTKGYAGDDLEMAVGISKEGIVTGVRIISHAETPGLGAKASDDSFLSQYVGKKASNNLVVTKTGAQSDIEIDAITGATKTANGVTNGVNYAFAYYNEFLGGGKVDG